MTKNKPILNRLKYVSCFVIVMIHKLNITKVDIETVNNEFCIV